MYPKIFADYFREYERLNEVFVIMPFSQEAEPRWLRIFRPAIQDIGLRPFRVKQARISDSILTDILAAIGRARLVLVDISNQRAADRPPGPNPNVMYELGLAHALRLPEEVIVVRVDDDPADPPFDISQIRYQRFDCGRPKRGRSHIRTLLRQTQKSIDATRDLIVGRMLASIDPDMMRFLWAVRGEDNFDLAIFDPDRHGTYSLSNGDTTEGHLRMLARSLIGSGLLQAGDPGPVRRRVYGGTAEYKVTKLGKAVITKLPRWCRQEGA